MLSRGEPTKRYHMGKQFNLPRKWLGFIAVFLAGVIGAVTFVTISPAQGATTTATKHYIANVSGSYSQAAALGYNVLDVSSVSNLSTLPAGTQAMFWLGSGQKCPTPVDSTFTTTVNNLAANASKVYGVYLSDEPDYNDNGCGTAGPANIKARNDYVKSKLPNVKTFIVIDNQAHFAPYRPAVTSVDLVGIDPYPFNVNGAPDYSKVSQRVSWATTGGWAKSSIVPTFQLFGQTCTTGGDKYYRFPTDAELNTLLSTWQANGPFSELDYSYGWKNQLPNTACPTLADKPTAQQIMKNYFAGTTSTPSATTTTTTGTPSTTTSTTSTPPATTTSTTTAAPTQTVTKTVTQTVTQPPVTTTVTVTPNSAVSELLCQLGTAAPKPGDNVTCAYK